MVIQKEWKCMICGKDTEGVHAIVRIKDERGLHKDFVCSNARQETPCWKEFCARVRTGKVALYL